MTTLQTLPQIEEPGSNVCVDNLVNNPFPKHSKTINKRLHRNFHKLVPSSSAGWLLRSMRPLVWQDDSQFLMENELEMFGKPAVQIDLPFS